MKGHPIQVRFVLILSFFIISDLSAQIDVLAEQLFTIDVDGNGVVLPHYSNHDISDIHRDIKRAVVVVHGTNRNADDYFDNMIAALRRRPSMIDETLIIAPQFLREDDIDAFGLGEEYVYWSSDGWKVGANSRNEASNPRPYRIPSYEIMDSLMISLPQAFPDLEYLVFTGHSAGGQFTNRYTASSPIFELLCTDYGISSKSIIANPGTYVYMSPFRRVEGTLDEFEVPSGCEEYNEYSYGLEDLYTYHSRVGADQMKDWYASREVVYLLGENDNDPDASTLPRSCRAMLLGDHRLERGLIYFNHILHTFSEEVRDFHSLNIIPGVGHDNAKMYQSEKGLEELFDKKPLSICKDQTTSTLELKGDKYVLFPNPTAGKISLNSDVQNARIIKVLDLNGRTVLTGVDGNTLDFSMLASGIYWVQLAIGNEISHQKVVHSK